MNGIDSKHLRNFRVTYHRNGCMGEGFHHCEFVWLEDGRAKKGKLLRAVVFDGKGRIGIINPADLGDRFRGDDFEDAVRAKIEEAVKTNNVIGSIYA